jgi:dihydrolipoamide dehydrogenase
MEKFDIVIIGSGPGGYVCAIKCAQLGAKVAIVEKYDRLGGTCLNVGCIPSKALLDSTEKYFMATHHLDHHGIEIKAKVDFSKMMNRVGQVVKQNADGVAYLMKKNKITVFYGVGQFQNAKQLHVLDSKDSKKVLHQLEANYFVIATGSKPTSLPGIKLDKKRIITSTEVLRNQDLKNPPKSLLVVGGGVIGLELGSCYARLGTKVQVIEYMPQLIPMMDLSLGKELEKCLIKEGMEFYFQHSVMESHVEKDHSVVLKVKNPQGEIVTFKAEYALISVGRKPYTEELGLENIGLTLNPKGQIAVNHSLQTNHPHIFAIGDVVQGPMLAHKAEEEGVFVAEKIAGQKPHIDYNLIPSVVYTWPEVASVGQSEEMLKTAKRAYKVGSFPMKALGRARASEDTDGFIKVLTDAQTDEILGVHMICARAADLIAQAAIAMEFRSSAEDLARTCFAHPTFSEALKEACMAAWFGKPLNF